MSTATKISVISFLGLLVAVLCLAPSACNEQARESVPAQDSMAPDSGHGLHVVQSTRLRSIMDELRALDLYGLSDEPEVTWHSGRDPVRVARLAADLAGDARLIPSVYRGTEMTAESRRVFDDLAATLESECNELARIAAKDDRVRMKSKVSEIVDTCNACHASFRGPVLAKSGSEPLLDSRLEMYASAREFRRHAVQHAGLSTE